MENLKNGRLFSSKYNSRLKLFPRPHVVVFANFAEPENAFSADRLVFFLFLFLPFAGVYYPIRVYYQIRRRPVLLNREGEE